MERIPVTLRLARPDELDLLVEIDEDAGRLYAEGGLPIDLAPDHPFVVAEQARWRSALALERVFLATDARGEGVGFAALGTLDPLDALRMPERRESPEDAAPYLEQLSVRRGAMGRGIGRRLLRRAIAWAAAYGHGRSDARSGGLWLTTYGHLDWNRPFYEREGFVVVPECEWPDAIARHIAEQRACLPHPDRRVAMRRALRDRPPQSSTAAS